MMEFSGGAQKDTPSRHRWGMAEGASDPESMLCAQFQQTWLPLDLTGFRWSLCCPRCRIHSILFSPNLLLKSPMVLRSSLS